MEEVWKDIEGYEGLYQVSNMGRVRSLDRIVSHYRGKQIRKGSIKALANGTKGYQLVLLYKNGNGKTHKVHRLVAQAFIPNPDNLPQVNHKDENVKNNNVENLEWCDNKYNANYGTHKIRLSDKLLNRKDKSKVVEQYDLDGNFICEYPSAQEAGRQNNINADSINSCCRGERKTSHGSIWMYKEKGAA